MPSQINGRWFVSGPPRRPVVFGVHKYLLNRCPLQQITIRETVCVYEYVFVLGLWNVFRGGISIAHVSRNKLGPFAMAELYRGGGYTGISLRTKKANVLSIHLVKGLTTTTSVFALRWRQRQVPVDCRPYLVRFARTMCGDRGPDGVASLGNYVTRVANQPPPPVHDRRKGCLKQERRRCTGCVWLCGFVWMIHQECCCGGAPTTGVRLSSAICTWLESVRSEY